jgi:hypothetical protein
MHDIEPPCNIKPVKLVDILGKWDNAHKDLERLQTELKLVKSEIQKKIPQASSPPQQPLDDMIAELEKRFDFFSDGTASSIGKALKAIEDVMQPLRAADPYKE